MTPATAIISHLKIVPTPKTNSPNITKTNTTLNKTKKVKAVPRTNTVVPVTDSDTKDDVSVTYTLWIGSNVTENYTISVIVSYNSTFYNVMQLAAQKDSHFM